MSLLQIHQWVCQWKNLWKSFNIWGSYGQEFSVLFFWDTLYLQQYVDIIHVEVGMQQANVADCSPQYTSTCLESSVVAGRPGECKKITPRPFLAGILTLKQCYRVHMNTPFSFRKLKKFPSAPVAPRTTCIRRSTFARPPLQNPRYATVHTTACMMHPVYHKYCNDCGNRSINVCSTCTSNTFLEELSVWV